MRYFVYIIFSSKNNLYYKGFTSNPKHRLIEHNKGRSRYTKGKGPWEMTYLEEFPDKKSALIREKQLKRYNHQYIQKLIKSDKNILGK